MQNHTTIDSPPPPSIHIARVDSPLGRIELTSDGTSITSLAIERDGRRFGGAAHPLVQPLTRGVDRERHARERLGT